MCAHLASSIQSQWSFKVGTSGFKTMHWVVWSGHQPLGWSVVSISLDLWSLISNLKIYIWFWLYFWLAVFQNYTKVNLFACQFQEQTRVDFWFYPADCYNTSWIWGWCQNAVHWNVEPAVQSSVFNRHVLHSNRQWHCTRLVVRHNIHYRIVERQNIQNTFTA